MNRKHRVTALGLVVSSVVTYAVISGATASTTAPSGRPALATIPAIPASVSAHFAILRRPQIGSDHPTTVAAGDEFAPHGGNTALAREPQGVQVGAPTADPMLVVPGQGSICLVHRFDMSGTCQSVADAEAGNAVTWAPCLPGLKPGQVRIAGLVPDGVSLVTLTLSDASSQTASVQDNSYEFVTPGSSALPVQVTFSANGTLATLPTSVSESDLPPTCQGQ